ncbi:hypothetical protein ABI59_07600 [Acidobacteria bacterium Mor1]|nr:hypothetical protein ABI59_07600 [Acidobacteria bacterium Mor1]
MKPLSGLRALTALLRVERRQLLKNRWRSLLVLGLVAIPVGAMVAGSTLARISQRTPAENQASILGTADLRIDGVEHWEDRERALAGLPSTARTLEGYHGYEQVGVPGRNLRARFWAFPPDSAPLSEPDGLAAGLLLMAGGRAPRNAGEVALSRALLDGLGVAVGDEVTLSYGRPRRITGIVVDPEDLALPLILRTPAAVELPATAFLLAQLDGSIEATSENVAADAERIATELRQAELTVRTRGDAAASDPFAALFVFALGVIGLFESSLVISAAFAVGLRRRQVEIGLLGANGATRGGITRALLASAGGIALLGGVIGTLLGVLAALAVHPWLDGLTNRLCGPFEFGPGQAVGPVVLGILAAVLAAVLPARAAARLGIREALSGRRPTAARSRIWLLLGATLVALSLALLLVPEEGSLLLGLAVVLGPILGIVGFGACAPWLLDGLARKAAPLPLPWRLAIRDAGRFRERNGAVVTAILAGMCMSITIAALVGGLEQALADFPQPYRDDQLWIEGPDAEAAARRIAAELPSIAVTPLVAAYTHGEPVRWQTEAEAFTHKSPWIAVGDMEVARVLGSATAAPALRRGELVSLDSSGDEVPSDIRLNSWVDGRELPLPKVSSSATGQNVREPAFLVGAALVEERGWAIGPPPSHTLVPWVVRLDAPVRPDQLARAQQIAAEQIRTTVDAGLLQGNNFDQAFYAVLLICMATGLVIVLIATALSSAESAPDEHILHTVGAAPSVLRGHVAARAGYLTLLGCTLAVPAGLIVAAALAGAVNFPLPFVVPWAGVLIVMAGFPALVFSVTWVLSWFGRQARSLRFSTS